MKKRNLLTALMICLLVGTGIILVVAESAAGKDDLYVGKIKINTEPVAATTLTVSGSSTTTLTATGDQIWHQNIAGIESSAEVNDLFGSSVVAGDFNNDGNTDLAIGVPGEGIGSIANGGAVNIIYSTVTVSGGTTTTLTATGDQIWHQNIAGIESSAEVNDRFGSSLAAGDFNNDGNTDLAIGVPGEGVGSIANAGAVNIIYSTVTVSGGTTTTLTATGDQIWHQNIAGIESSAEVNDSFGSSLAVGDFNKDGYSDLAIGVPGEGIGSIANGGAVNIIYGSAGGLTSTSDQIWHQNIAGIESSAEVNDRFGSSLAVGDFNKDGYSDLAIGVPGEGIGSIANGGAVNVIYGSAGGLTSTSDQIWHQNIAGIESSAEVNDRFGSSLAAGDFNDDGYSDLAIGVPGEGIGSIAEGGAVNVIYGSSGGLTSTNDQIWHQNIAGIESSAEVNDRFGSSLAAGDFNNDGYSDLAIGVPGEGIGSVAEGGAVNIIYGSSGGLTSTNDQIWHQNIAGIESSAEVNDRFGSSLAVGDFNRNGYTDLAIGVPGEGIGSIANGGAVNVIYS